MKNSPTGNNCKSWLNAYENHLEKVLGLAPATRTSYLLIARRLLTEISKNDRIDRSMFTPSNIIEFVQVDTASRKGRSGTTISATRSFIRFLISYGMVSSNLETVLPNMWYPKHAVLPERLSEAEVRKVIKFADNGSAKGIRDVALLLLFARLGLRVDEVAYLSLDDIDWVDGNILIRAGKTRRERILPLPDDLAKAILRYLKCSRARSIHREIFIHSTVPNLPYKPDSIGKIVKRLLRQAGIPRASCNAHLFRHTLASSLINQGATFKEIADVLGHQALITTAVYAKLDLRTLTTIALPWPRGDE